MASFEMQVAPWPAGQTVNAYPAQAWPDPARAPSGPVAAAAVVSASNTLLLEGLSDNSQYVAYALGIGVRFGTSTSSLNTPVALADRARIKALEDAVSAGGGGGGGGGSGGARVLLYDETAADYLPDVWRSDTSVPREFVGPVDPSTLSTITGPIYGDRWTPTAGPE